MPNSIKQKLDTSVLAEKKDSQSQYNLGLMYEHGTGVPKNYKEARKWYRLSAEQGNALAQLNLGVIYDKGQGVPQNYKEAIKWYRISAEQGNAETQYILGTMYRDGLGVPQDYALAHMWFNVCASTGNEKCMKQRNRVEKKMTPSQIEKAQDMARNWKPKTEDQLRKLMEFGN